MKKKGGLLFIVFIVFFIYSNFYTESVVIGTYVNRNYDKYTFIDVPKESDTLQVLENNKFISKYYGEGTYKLLYDVKGTRIRFTYKDEALNLPMKRRYLLGGLKIALLEDLNQYYEKVSD